MPQTALKMPSAKEPTFTAVGSDCVEYTVRYTYYLVNGRIVRDIDIVDKKIVIDGAVINIGRLNDDH